jgi:hypothetical protein
MSNENYSYEAEDYNGQLRLEVVPIPEDKEVYVKISGFVDHEDADEYADYLVETLPLLLFNPDKMH